ncbi:MAG TPA: CPBP family glutamic-type intramembrane protease [Bryobacteraceae bacterium]|nr:CPBP family glutamic-type intramembrane protease [Bryobacteraceae bacterium]
MDPPLHGVDLQSPHSIQVYRTAMLLPGLIGVVLTWLRGRSASVWPAVVFHDFVNTVLD